MTSGLHVASLVPRKPIAINDCALARRWRINIRMDGQRSMIDKSSRRPSWTVMQRYDLSGLMAGLTGHTTFEIHNRAFYDVELSIAGKL